MSSPNSSPTLEDVLDAFAIEPETDSSTLQRYLRDYPQFAERLIDLSQELSREPFERRGPLAAEDMAKIDAAWSRHFAAAPVPIPDPLATLSVENLRELSRALQVPRQVITAFRERKVDVASVPCFFLTRFAAGLKVRVEQLVDALSLPPAPQFARSYKSDVKPGVPTRATFEQILREAGVPDEERAKLMAEG